MATNQTACFNSSTPTFGDIGHSKWVNIWHKEPFGVRHATYRAFRYFLILKWKLFILSFCIYRLGFLLVRFITNHLSESRHLMSTIEARNLEESGLVIRCINDLGLIQLDRDDSLSSDAMVDSCNRLLSSASLIRHLTHGNHLVVTRFFSVMSDGRICIPWNFKASWFSKSSSQSLCLDLILNFSSSC